MCSGSHAPSAFSVSAPTPTTYGHMLAKKKHSKVTPMRIFYDFQIFILISSFVEPPATFVKQIRLSKCLAKDTLQGFYIRVHKQINVIYVYRLPRIASASEKCKQKKTDAHKRGKSES